MRTEGALYQSPTPCNLRPYQGTPSSLTRSQGTSKGGGVPGEIPQPIRQRRHHFESGFVPLVFVAVAIVAWRNPLQQNTPLGLTALPTDTVEVTDPTHPLYGLSFPLIGITVKQRLGRVCLVWLHPGIERAITGSATNPPPQTQLLSPCRPSPPRF